MTPCMNCTKRYPGCHSECAAYLAMRAKLDAQNADRAKQKTTLDDIIGMNLKSIKRSTKRSVKAV